MTSKESKKVVNKTQIIYISCTKGSVSFETVATYERFDIENDVKGDKFKDELKEFCRPFSSKFF